MLAFIGPTGVGKSTAARIARQIVPRSVLIKVATPLYDVQSAFYNRLGIDDGGRQDGELLQFLGGKVQRDHPGFLASDFLDRFSHLNLDCVDLVINDDARMPTLTVLQRMGFTTIRVQGPIRARDDLSSPAADHETEQGLDRVGCDLVLDNSSDIGMLADNLKIALGSVRPEFLDR